MARRAVEAVADLEIPHQGNKPYNVVTISLDMVLCRIEKGDEVEIETLYSRAHALMYRVKREGRNGFVVEEMEWKRCKR